MMSGVLAINIDRKKTKYGHQIENIGHSDLIFPYAYTLYLDTSHCLIWNFQGKLCSCYRRTLLLGD